MSCTLNNYPRRNINKYHCKITLAFCSVQNLKLVKLVFLY